MSLKKNKLKVQIFSWDS